MKDAPMRSLLFNPSFSSSPWFFLSFLVEVKGMRTWLFLNSGLWVLMTRASTGITPFVVFVCRSVARRFLAEPSKISRLQTESFCRSVELDFDA